MEDLTGKQLGPYQIVAPLGEGGMAAVYKAYQPAMDRYVALKVLPRHFASDPQFVTRFQQEARVVAQLQHPHILPVFDFGEADGYTYIVMPFVKSGTLTDLLKGPALSLPHIRTLVTQIGGALDYAHARGLIHRDVKPSNVLIDETGNCLLTDFGLAKIIEGSIHLTTSGAIMGTPAYMSPEQGLGHKIDKRSDIYSLGVILYEMAVGRTPYVAETPMAVVIKHINDPLPPPHTIKPDLPEALERVILKALAKHPDDRFASAGEMVRALQAAIPETTLAAPTTEAALRIEEPAPETVKQAPPQVKTEQAAPAEPVAPETVKPSAPPLAVPTRMAAPKPLWQSVLITALGWLIGVLLGLPFASGFVPLGGLVAGAIGGLSMGWAWRRMEPSVSRGRMFTLAGIWAVVGAVAVVTGPGFFVLLAIAGWLSGLVMRRAQPALTRRDAVVVGLGWGLSWLLGGVMFAVGTQVEPRPLSGVIVVLAIALAGGLGGWITFGRLRAARERTLPPSERAKSKVPVWVYVIAGLVILACLAAFAIVGGKAANDRAATQTAAYAGGLPTNTALPGKTSIAPTQTKASVPSATRVLPAATGVPPSLINAPTTQPTATRPKPTPTKPAPTRAAPATATAAGTEATNWRVDSSYRFPDNFWAAGTHQYTLVSNCPGLPPESSNSWTNSFDVSEGAAVLPGDVYLRLNGLRHEGTPVSAIHPSQPTVAQLSWVEMTKADADQYTAACIITVIWDGGAPVTLTAGAPYQP